MPDHAIDLGVDEFLGDDRALLRIGLVILGHQFELDLGATDFQALGIQFVDGHACAVLIIFAEVCLGPRERCHMADLDHQLGFRCGGRGGCRRGGGCGRGGFGFLFLAAADQGEGRSDSERGAG